MLMLLILFSAFVLLIVIACLLLQGFVYETIRRNAEHRAERWVKGFVQKVPDLHRLAETGNASAPQNTAIETMIAGTDIFRFKLFSPAGDLVFISDEAWVQSSDGDIHSETAKQVLSQMKNDISVKDGQSNPNRPDTFVEAYLPVMSATNEVMGVIEVYVDVSWLAINLNSKFYEHGTILVAMIAFAFFALSGPLVYRNKRARRERSLETWLTAILYNAPFEVVIKDTKGKIRAISRNVVEEFHLADADFLGKTTADFLPANIASVYMDADREVIRSGEAAQIEVFETVDGRTRNSLCSKFPLVDSQGRTTGICSITNDITEMKASEEALAQAQKMEAVGQLTGGIAHDFNNLLAIIMWSAEELQTKLGASDKRTNLIIETTKKGAFLTQQLLSFSRKQNLTPRSIDVEILVLKLSEMLARTLGETIEISTNFSEDLPHALVDANQLENALLNLALNARDAMPKGGILSIDCSIVTSSDIPEFNLDEQLPEKYIVMSVSDNGIGMEADVLEHAFEPFYTTKDVGRGSGLGLSMVYGFAQQSNGHVTVESNVGIGTTISLYLPVASPDPLRQHNAAKARRPIQTQKMRVLLLEDDFKVRKLAQKRLEALGHTVSGFGCASDALIVLSEETKFDLLLTDVVLPGGVSGPDFASKMLENQKNLRVLFMSGYPQSSLDSTDFSTEMGGYLRKPFTSKALEAAMADAMS